MQTSLTSSYMLDNILAILQDECRKANEKTTDLAKLGQQLTQAQTMLEKVCIGCVLL